MNLVRRMKRKFQKSESIKLANWRKSNAKEFWKEIKSRDNTKMDALEKISDDYWVKYFERIVGTSAHNHRDYDQPHTDGINICNKILQLKKFIGQFGKSDLEKLQDMTEYRLMY